MVIPKVTSKTAEGSGRKTYYFILFSFDYGSAQLDDLKTRYMRIQEGFRVSEQGTQIYNLQFADDPLFFLVCKASKIQPLKNLLNLFSISSGLKSISTRELCFRSVVGITKFGSRSVRLLSRISSHLMPRTPDGGKQMQRNLE